MTIGEILRKRRLELHMTTEELGNIIGVQRSAISKYEQNRVDLKSKQIQLIAQAIECAPSSLLPDDAEDPISADEAFLLDVYRKLSRAGRDYLMQQLTIASNMFGEKSDTVSKSDIV